MSNDGDTVTLPRAHDAPLTKEQRASKQALFLKEYAECGNVKYCCQVAGISRKTFYQWKSRDKTFQSLLADVEPDACDVLEYAAYERAVKGIESYVVSQGRMVYEDIPAFNKDGTPKLDAYEKQVMLHGAPLTERKYSDTLLITLLKARIPAKYRDKQQIDLNAQITTLADTAKAELLADLAAAMTNEDQESSQ